MNPENPGTPQGQAPAGAPLTPPTVTQGNPPTPQGQAPQATPTPDTMTLEDAQKVIADLRKENASRRVEAKELAELRAAKEATEQAQMSELQKAQAALKATSDRADALQARAEVAEIERVAAKLGIVDPELAALAIRDKITRAADGTPDNIETELRALVKTKPHLVNAQLVGGSPANAPRDPSAGGSTFLESQLADFDFYMKNKAAIDKATREGRIIRGR